MLAYNIRNKMKTYANHMFYFWLLFLFTRISFNMRNNKRFFFQNEPNSACWVIFHVSVFLSSAAFLTHLCRMCFPILINWTSPFQNLGLLGGIFHCYSNSKRNFCMQTVENLIRRRILRRLIWFCTVCRCPTKKIFQGWYQPVKQFTSNSDVTFVRPDLGPNYQQMTKKGH